MIDRPDTPHADVLLAGIWEDEVTPDDLASRALSAAQASSYAFRVASEGTSATAQLGEVDVSEFLESETGKWAKSFIGIVRVGESLVHVSHALGELARNLQQVNLEQSEIVYRAEAEIEAAERQSARVGADPADRVAELIADARARAAEVADRMVTPESSSTAVKPPVGLVSGFMAFGRTPGTAAPDAVSATETAASPNNTVQAEDDAGMAPQRTNGHVSHTHTETPVSEPTAPEVASTEVGGPAAPSNGFLGLGRVPSLSTPAGEAAVPVVPVVPVNGVEPRQVNGVEPSQVNGAGPTQVNGAGLTQVNGVEPSQVNGSMSLGRTPTPGRNGVHAPANGVVPVAVPTGFLPVPIAAGAEADSIDGTEEHVSAPVAEVGDGPHRPEPAPTGDRGPSDAMDEDFLSFGRVPGGGLRAGPVPIEPVEDLPESTTDRADEAHDDVVDAQAIDPVDEGEPADPTDEVESAVFEDEDAEIVEAESVMDEVDAVLDDLEPDEAPVVDDAFLEEDAADAELDFLDDELESDADTDEPVAGANADGEESDDHVDTVTAGEPSVEIVDEHSSDEANEDVVVEDAETDDRAVEDARAEDVAGPVGDADVIEADVLDNVDEPGPDTVDEAGPDTVDEPAPQGDVAPVQQTSPAPPEPDAVPAASTQAATPGVRAPRTRVAPKTVKFSDLLKAANAQHVDPARVSPAAVGELAAGAVDSAAVDTAAVEETGADAAEGEAEASARPAPVLATGPVILGRTEPLVLTKKASPAVQQVHDAIASILGSLRGGPHGPDSGLHWAAGLFVKGEETVMAVTTSDAGWLPPDVVIPGGARVLWNMPNGCRWASVDDPVRQLIEYAEQDGYALVAAATTHPSRAYVDAVGEENFVRVLRPGAVLAGGRSRFEATVSPVRLEHIRSLDRDQALRQARALIRDLETQPIGHENAVGIEAARLDARCFLDEGAEVPPPVLEQLHNDEQALRDVLSLDRTPASAQDLTAEEAPTATRLRDRMLERAIVVATLAAAYHDIESAVYAWTYARFLASQNEDSSRTI